VSILCNQTSHALRNDIERRGKIPGNARAQFGACRSEVGKDCSSVIWAASGAQQEQIR
jgi:hypothetical protein